MLSGNQIKGLREQRGWEQRELATVAQVHPSVVSRLERNLQEDVKLSVVVAIASALGVTVDSLLPAEGRARSVEALAPELQSIVSQLAIQTVDVQLQAAGILRGYLSTL